MSNEITKKPPSDLDGFDGFTDEVQGAEERVSASTIQGTRIKFTNEAMWVTFDGLELDANAEFIGVDVGRFVVKWGDDGPIEDGTITLAPGEKFPDVKAMNEKAPKAEWREGPDGKPCGPYQAQHVLYLLDPTTLDKYSWPTATVGGSICIREFTDKVKWMRRFRGQHVYAVVTLSDVFMNTRFGGRQRPGLLVKRWVALGADELPALENPSAQAALAAPADQKKPAQAPPEKPAQTPQDESGLRTVEPPSLSEEMGDEIPSKGDVSMSGQTTALASPHHTQTTLHAGTVRIPGKASAGKKPATSKRAGSRG
jgi:hypothetical protein